MVDSLLHASISKRFPKKPRKRVVINTAHTRYNLIKSIAQAEFNWRTSAHPDTLEWDILWTDSAVSPETLLKMKPYQKINHFPGSSAITRKNLLGVNLNKMRDVHPRDYNFHPRTWVLPQDYADLKNCCHSTLICKPEASSQGKGIFLTNSSDIFASEDRCVVQEYIETPLLIDGNKADFRLYVLLTGSRPLRAYIYKEGIVRLATEQYTPPHLNNLHQQFMHLTNYAINKKSTHFVENSDPDQGHKRSLLTTFAYLRSKGCRTNHLWREIKQLVLKTLCVLQPKIAQTYRACQPKELTDSMCFELMGFDVLIDSALKPWLLEVNHSPSFSTGSALDEDIKGKLIRDTFTLLHTLPGSKKTYEATRTQHFLNRSMRETKQEIRDRQQLAAFRIQVKRDEWELGHLGNFEPVVSRSDKHGCSAYLKAAEELLDTWSVKLSKPHIKKPLDSSRKIIKHPQTRHHSPIRTSNLVLPKLPPSS